MLRRYVQQYGFLSLCLLGCLTAVMPAQAAGEALLNQHAIAMHGTPKYGADFQHLDYVNPEAPQGGTLRLAKTGSFDNLNQLVITGNAAEGLQYLNDQLLMRVWDEPFTMYGLVAEKLDLAADRSWVVFYLNKAARFHDGVPMTSADVKFSYDMYRKHGHPVRRRVYSLVKEVVEIDDHTIKFTFGEGFDRETVMILALMHVLPKHYWETRDITKTTLTPPLGSGPYKIKSVDPGRQIIYERVKDHWAKDLPINRGLYNFDTLTYTYFRDNHVALQAFKSGDYDVRRESDVGKWKSAYDFKARESGAAILEEIEHGRPEWLRAFVYNTRRPLFADRRVRRALSYMLDADWLNKNIYFGEMKRTESIFANSELAARGKPVGEELAALSAFHHRLPAEVFDTPGLAKCKTARDCKRRAMSELKAAGWHYQDQKLLSAAGEPFAFEILLGSILEEKLALSFANSLKKLGIDVSVRVVDSAQFAGRLESFDFDMLSFKWINSLSPGNEQMNYWGSAAADNPGSRNYAGVKSQVVDKLADGIARTVKREGLVARARALDRVLIQGYYMIPLFYHGKDLVARYHYIHRPDVTPVYGVVLESWWSEEGRLEE